MTAERGQGNDRHGQLRVARWRRWRAAVAVAITLCGLAPTVPSLATAATGSIPGGSGRAAVDATDHELPGPFAGRYAEPLARPYAQPMSAPGALTVGEQTRVAAYWSADRRIRAQAAPPTSQDNPPGPASPGPAAAADRVPAATALPPPSTGGPYHHGGAVTTTVGRLFTTIRGVDYACSATVVTSPGRDLAVTAGHCLHEGTNGAFATNIAFMPGYADGQLPHGLWTARRVTVTPDWGRRGDFDYDTGFVLFNTRGGRHIQDVVGAERIAFNQPRTLAQYAFGYPRLLPYDGERLIYCAGTPRTDPYGSASVGLGCDMTGGASGGPLIVGLGRAGPGTGWVDSVISYAYAGDSSTIYGTYFGRAIELLYYQSIEL